METPEETLSLHQAGIRVTERRRRILNVLMRAAGPLTAKQLSKTVPSTDAATVYRALGLFERKGLVRRVGMRQNGASFEYVSPTRHHHHLICESCGRIEDLEGCGLEPLLRSASRNAAFRRLTGHIVEIYGLCRDCM